ncbi:hypothetical protein KBD75_02155 [Candidatus Woesebacteria bacterium]|nr:hypothetical protein [Candidatus Woesebacteria bacterium]
MERRKLPPIKEFFGPNLHALKRVGAELSDFTLTEIGALATYSSSLPKRVSIEILSQDPPRIKIMYANESDAIKAEKIIVQAIGFKAKDRPKLDGTSKEDI